MTPSLHKVSSATPGAGGPGIEVLYEGERTRVFRRPAGAGVDAVVYKEPRGADARRRLDHERDILTRLAGIEGIPRLAEGSCPAHLLALRDRDATPLAHALRDGPWEIDTLITASIALTRTLGGIHRAGVVHRDISPANILLCATGGAGPSRREPLLIDFDLALLDGAGRGDEEAGEMVGTLGYLAPEQTGRTGRTADQRADLYALGAILYEMATGRPVFEADDSLRLVHAHLVHEPVAPMQVNAALPAILSDAILRLLAKEPERRYQSADGLLHDLARLRDDLAQGVTSVFALGERDFPARLAPPEHLVGRANQLQLLEDTFKDSLRTRHRVVLIEGAPGVGKSALVNELRPLVKAAGGWFVQGKFDQYHRDTAATATVQALTALGRLLLAAPRDELVRHRQRILDRLGRNAVLMTRMFPEFELLLGEQPEAASVDPGQAELRVQQAMLDLLGAIGSPEHPLVVFLDDLQWAGGLSCRLLERLLAMPDLRGVMLVGALRPEEIDAAHPLSSMLARWSQLDRPPLRMALHNLDDSEAGELIGRMLRLPRERADELARAVSALTQGNPFDTVEMINALRQDGVLTLEPQGWEWDATAIRHFVGNGTVVDLLAARIAQLPAASRTLLDHMSCLGGSVQQALLKVALDLDDQALGQHLRPPVDDGLLVMERDDRQLVRFRHDRVQQAVLDRLDASRRSQDQLNMARRLAREPAWRTEASQQYLASAVLIREPKERRDTASMFVDIAARLAGSASYALAETYLAAADALLADLDEPSDLALRGRVEQSRHAALYSLGRLAEADQVHGAVQSRITDPLDALEPTCIQMRSLTNRGLMVEALALGKALLGRLGLEIPAGGAATDMPTRIQALDLWIREDKQADLRQRPAVQDRRVLAMAKLLNRMLWLAYLFDRDAFVRLLLESLRLWTVHGPCADLVPCLGRAGIFLITTRDDYRSGFDAARHVLAVGQARGFEPETSEARTVFALSACHWLEPLEESLGHATRAREILLEAGDGAYACYTYRVTIQVYLDCAPTLERYRADTEAGRTLSLRTGNSHSMVMTELDQQLLSALEGRFAVPGSVAEATFDEQAFMARHRAAPVIRVFFHMRRALAAALFDDLPALIRHSACAKSQMDCVLGYYVTVHGHLLRALALARQLQDDAVDDREPLLTELGQCLDWLAARSADQPLNFRHLLCLVEAEQAWAIGDLWKAAGAFDAALDEAQSRQRPWHHALIAERAARFHLATGRRHAARQLLTVARDLYAAWGARAKVQLLEDTHGFLRRDPSSEPVALAPDAAWVSSSRRSSAVSPDTLDLMGVLRASQALSSETSLSSLVTRVSDVLAALTGASKVSVVLREEGQWHLLEPASAGQPIRSFPVVQAAEDGLLPLSAFHYAQRTRAPLLVDDAVSDDRFARDPYFDGRALCSLLVVPIANQGEPVAVLLLEGRHGRAAFSAQRLDAVMLVASQLAVSVTNAQLYDTLEQRVQARTRELQQAQAQLVSTARQAGMAEIANNVLHNVGNALNSVNVSASLVNDLVRDSRLSGLTRAVSLLTAQGANLGDFLTQDPKGKMLPVYLEQLAATLAGEQQHMLAELGSLTRSVSYIRDIVTLQQSYAGASSVVEPVHVQELLEDGLRMNAQSLARHMVTIVREFAALPLLLLDKPRLLQILVNLIANAAQAMDGQPEENRLMTLGAALARRADRSMLVITVRDQGMGIAPENLARIFSHGFTTKKDGHGFGLHSCALAAREMGGTLAASSDGPGQGAVFTLELPAVVSPST